MADSADLSGSSPNRGPTVFVVTTITIAIASVFVAARLVCRIGIIRRVTWDDYFMIIAWFLAAGLSATIDIATTKGLGKHDANIPDKDRDALRKTEYTTSVLYYPALMATKTSVLIFYLRLSKNTQKVLRAASWVVLGIVNVSGIIITFLNIFQCTPIQATFSTTTEDRKCLPLLTEFLCAAPVNIVTDLAILALPLPVLTGMRLPSRQKTILVFTFSLAVFVTIIDVIRISYLQAAVSDLPEGTVTRSSSVPFGGTTEFSWHASFAFMWIAVEVNVGMVCACIPTLKPLIMKILPAMLVDPDATGTSRELNNTSAKRSSTDGSALPATGTTGGLQQPAGDNGPALDRMPSLDFITTPDMAGNGPQAAGAGTSIQAAMNAATFATTSTVYDNGVYFGFVNMKRPKVMTKTSVRESFKYCTIVTILFLLWGFSYGLLNTLNNAIASLSHMSAAETLGLTSAYFGGGYFFGPLVVGEWVLRHDEHARFHDTSKRSGAGDAAGGFKATFIMGLSIYGIGTIMFWPSAAFTSFAGFMVSNFVVGFGLAVLETAANPFMILCGPPQYGEMRILIAQGIQGVATVLSGLLARNVFDDIEVDRQSGPAVFMDVQWTYLAITLFCAALALFFYYMPLPEATDEDLGRTTSRLRVDPLKRSIGHLQLRTVSIILAVAAQWTYVAGQECMSIFFEDLITSYLPNQTSSTPNGGDDTTTTSISNPKPSGLTISTTEYLFIAHAAFAISRFNAAHLAYLSAKHPNNRFLPSPRTVLTISTLLSVVFALVAVLIKPVHNTNLMAIPVILFYFAEGPLWPLIFALGLRGQGRRTKRASAWLTMGGSGPVFWPFVMYAVVRGGGTVQLSFVVVVALLVVTLAYPVFLIAVKDARLLADGTVKANGHGAGGGMGGGEGDSEGEETAREGSPGGDDPVLWQRRWSTMSTLAASFVGRISNKLSWSRRGTAATLEPGPGDGVPGGHPREEN
ncbi:Fucose permease [Pleurostoma richardsiae]|uniref:Fucose permease n=1 Tax=Pleurostoma richardsiae TaxID=41990 RepID=A0AA38RSL1_9PEZI|nr:Fucose permease [Pleurostoma richardsiae]